MRRGEELELARKPVWAEARAGLTECIGILATRLVNRGRWVVSEQPPWGREK